METAHGQPGHRLSPANPSFNPNRSSPGEPQAQVNASDLYDRSRQVAQRETRVGITQAWISVGLGLAGLLAPRAVSRLSGLPYWPTMLRAIGARELASGLGLFAQPKSAVWRWARVAGDAMDGAVLGAAFFAPTGRRRRLVATVGVVGAIVALDLRASAARRRSLSSQALPGGGGRRRVCQSIMINCAPEECYRSWRNFENFPSFMQHIESVQALDQGRTHWRATAPGGSRAEWDAEITEDQPNQLIGWRALPGSQVENSGTVRFAPAPGGKGTVLAVDMEYKPPAGAAGTLVAKLFGEEPAQQVRGDLRRFKQLLETGEIPTTRGQSHGERTMKSSLFNKEVEQ
ncbi:MAG: SRPBCC family protein [Massilia sp.]